MKAFLTPFGKILYTHNIHSYDQLAFSYAK